MPKKKLQEFVKLLELNEHEQKELFHLAGHDYSDASLGLDKPSPPKFPLTASQKDEVKPKSYMETTVYLHETGLLEGNTHLWTENAFWGFTGGVYVMFRNKQNEILWGTEAQTYGVNGSKVPDYLSDRCVVWWDNSAQGRDLGEIYRLEIVHIPTPSARVLKGIINVLRGRSYNEWDWSLGSLGRRNKG